MKNVLLILLLCIAIPSTAQTELTDANAESKLLVDNDRLIVLDFYATWCGPCKRMDPIIAELEKKYKDRVDFYKIDVDKNKVDDALGVNAMPTYLFIYNSANLEQIEGAMSKSKMQSLIEKHMGGDSGTTVSTETASDESFYDATAKHGDSDEFSQATLDKIWDSSTRLNSLAWHTYKEHSDIDSLLKAIKVVERSVELEATYYNVDTHAALLYKTGNYTKALKKAKKAVDIAKEEGLSYASTTELIEKIIDKM
ncbi:thioredoxin fold domain-containing protein [Kordia sp. YSTF-M3]|uniref:Thioredoxin fold domain-containing protein n=1 Tax=Kordia aestuariivivens TaxID=2759037 RepID=A0ABR7QAW6_9FLAO|nr:thioredoxin domain-containing protein [Kordia aestuariivivens]MBC8755694.1 thioredoxin fold domain-containing protein [Kordia aestuariivivens]